LHLLSLIDRNDPICEIVARKIIAIEARVTREPEEIAKLVVDNLTRLLHARFHFRTCTA
jgi:hypothetical protein